MKIDLKGVHKVSAKGRVYWYAWRGGPRLVGEAGSPEFVNSYLAAHTNQKTRHRSKFKLLIGDYQQSARFARLRDSTKVEYLDLLRIIEDQWAELPIEALDARKFRKRYKDWLSDLSERRGRCRAQAVYSTFRQVWRCAFENGDVRFEPLRLSRLYTSDRSDIIWADHNVAAFRKVAYPELVWALQLALETAQRQGDLLRMTWHQWDGHRLDLTQKKYSQPVIIPATTRLRQLMSEIPRRSPVILTNTFKHPWKPNSFRKAFGRVKQEAGLERLHFHDARGTAATRLAEAGCTVPEIAAITGWSVAYAAQMLDKYLKRTPELSNAAINKLEIHRAKKTEL
jgi:integrase